MKIGYPCINRSIGCTANSTFRLANYSESNLIDKVTNNLNCLSRILRYNIDNHLLFFRISSDLIPFASHPICTFNWQEYFRERFQEIGDLILENDIRISMHPDQFVLINSNNESIVTKSILDLKWHCEILDLMGLDEKAKVQIHVGGVYGDKNSAVERFVDNYKKLPNYIKNRLAIENDEKLYSLKECISISKKTGTPVIFDSFHHSCLNNGESMKDAIELSEKTWKKQDGILMTDYSSQATNERFGKHTTHIDVENFRDYLNQTREHDFDIMLEIKDKEKSALKAIEMLKNRLI
ncbi:MAG TPA: UV DNA damage repair endonuclease UvsE [Methanofastidiosum sp.]|jgi:UV DNA damage endonuclease|nr:UV DNA damage repair endonuclease UvsE [Methanofastidiosum sp.]